MLGGVGWYPDVIRKKDGEPGRGSKAKGIRFVGSIRGVIKELEKECCMVRSVF